MAYHFDPRTGIGTYSADDAAAPSAPSAPSAASSTVSPASPSPTVAAPSPTAGPSPTGPSPIDWSSGTPRVLRNDVALGMADENGKQSWMDTRAGWEGTQVEDPYRAVNYQDLASAGHWNLADPASEAYRVLNANVFGGSYRPGSQFDVSKDPHQFAAALLGMGVPEDQWEAALSGLDEESLAAVVGELQGTMEAKRQSFEDKDWNDYADTGMEMLTTMVAMGMLGAGFGAFAAAPAAAAGATANAVTGATAGGLGMGSAGTMAAKAGIGMLNGGTWQDALTSQVMGAGMSEVASAAAPYASSVADYLSGAGAEFDLSWLRGSAADALPLGSQAPDWYDPTAASPAAREAALAQAADINPMADPAVMRAMFGDPAGVLPLGSQAPEWYDPMAASPAAREAALMRAAETNLMADPSVMGAFAPQMGFDLSGLDKQATLDADDARNRDALEAGDDLNPEKQPAVTPEQLEKYAKAAKSIYGMLGQDAPSGPQQREGQSAEEFAVESQNYFIQHLGLNPEDVASAGPLGSREAMNYILAQADSVIAQLGLDPDFLADASVEDLQAALRDKTEEEQDQLARALYTRGALGAMSFETDAVDPFSGNVEELGNAGKSVHGSRAAHERGRARDVRTLAQLKGQDARRFLGGLLDRDADLFGIQAQSDADKLTARLNEQTPEGERKKRSAGDWADLLDDMSPAQLQALLRSFGGDEDRSRAALSRLISNGEGY